MTDLKDLNQPLISINETTNDHKKPPLAALQQPSNDPGRALVKRLNAERKAREKKRSEAERMQ